MPIFNPRGASSPDVITQLPFLSRWYSAKDIFANGTAAPATGSSLATWYDKSGMGKDITAAGSAQPTYNVDGVTGKPLVNFNGVAQTMTGAIISGTLLHTITVVSRTSSTSTQEVCVYNGNSGANGYGYYVFTARNILFGGASGGIKGDGGVTTNFEIVSMTWDGTTAKLYVNGALQSITNATAGAPNAPTGNFAIGSNAAGGNFWVGDVQEVITRSGALTLSQLQAEWAYLSGKWNVAAA